MLAELPEAVVALKGDMKQFCSAQGGRSTVLDTEADFLHVYERLPGFLLPIMMIDRSGFPDVYAIDCSQADVVVWCDDVVVKRWNSLESFRKWLRAQNS
jgi:hypothetical protein